ncbi:glucose-6-phosphate isomerase [Paludicola sp. MB14-C6]|uniref:glucose-6-phosphate isomerase n=1 Tax=Paludihabitans sp. MB14-C6 TaxID=3070656 RepID=UPI0027DE39C3|nr:glucose-6-phosphate isomerase [Paludicola sp. MB14-C6]WMJ23753.1 glucose-6-phosphate isomerase [Paludicola sp. MB14-C6]
MTIRLNDNYVTSFVTPLELKGLQPHIGTAHNLLHNKTGLGNDFLGWVTLPTDYDKQEFARIQKAAEKIKASCDILIVIGIGGSYLGARAAIELLQSPFYNNKKKDTPDIYFVGNNTNPTYLNEILSLCDGKDVCVNIISKSGTTTEPAIAFRVFRELLINKYGVDGAKERIFATTDKARGTLKELSDKEGYETFVIADDVGGRFSVLTAVGLLPIAVSGCDIQKIMDGAKQAQDSFMETDLSKNDCYRYAAYRNIFYRKGKAIELLVSYEPAFTMMAEWYKQLFGESEGKDNKGIFPASATFSTDLHSLGQWIQDGTRNIFETVMDIKKPKQDFFIEEDKDNFDGLNFLANQNMSIVNQNAMKGTILAHTEGGVPNLVLELEEINEFNFGYLVYFFEKACAISGYILGVNPFDQPGVESYKKNMFALLNKPGFESEREKLLGKL